jgi:hypothetical protein
MCNFVKLICALTTLVSISVEDHKQRNRHVPQNSYLYQGREIIL